jgi:hypothetical protein
LSANAAPLELRDYLALLWRRKWIIASMTVVAVGAALFYSFRQIPVYASSSEVVVRPVRLDPVVSPRGTAGFVNMETEIRMANSGSVAELAIEKLEASGTEPAEVSASRSQVLTVTKSAPSRPPRSMASRKVVTGVPLGVCPGSGSWVSRPINCTLFMLPPFARRSGGSCTQAAREVTSIADLGPMSRPERIPAGVWKRCRKMVRRPDTILGTRQAGIEGQSLPEGFRGGSEAVRMAAGDYRP